MLRREVFKAKDKMTEKLVTLKEVAMENEEEDVSSLSFVFVFLLQLAKAISMEVTCNVLVSSAGLTVVAIATGPAVLRAKFVFILWKRGY